MTRGPLHSAAPEIVLATDTDAPTGQRGVVEVVAALRCLWPLVRPLVVEAELGAVDPELGIALTPVALARPNHRLLAPLPAGVVPRQRLPDPIDVRVDALTPEAVGDWLGAVLGQDAQGQEVAWSQLLITAARVRTSERLPATIGLLDLQSQPFEVATEPDDAGGSWVAGPTEGSSLDPPIRVVFRQDGHLSRLALAAVWPLWSEPDTPGGALLVQTVAQLVALGWTRA